MSCERIPDARAVALPIDPRGDGLALSGDSPRLSLPSCPSWTRSTTAGLPPGGVPDGGGGGGAAGTGMMSEPENL